MTFPNEMTMYCTICGGPIFEPGVNCPVDWLSRAILLRSEDDEQPNSPVREVPAENKGGPFFELCSGRQRVTACDTDVRGNSFVDLQPPLYIPNHAACIQIAYQVCAASDRFNSEEDSLQHIWKVFEGRFYASSEERMISPTHLYEPNDFRGCFYRFQDMSWEPGEDPELRYESLHFEADPVEIRDFTASVISHLQLIPKAVLDATFQKPNLSKLPPEISDTIIEQLGALCDPSLDCTFLMDPSYWCQALLNRTSLPWLPELDVRLIAKKEESLPLNQDWNWELLVRQLAQGEIYKPKRVLQDLPMGLRNRSRIWTLVEDILATEVPGGSSVALYPM